METPQHERYPRAVAWDEQSYEQSYEQPYEQSYATPSEASYAPASDQYARTSWAGGRGGQGGGSAVDTLFSFETPRRRGGAEMTRQIMGQGMGGRAAGGQTPSSGRRGDSSGMLGGVLDRVYGVQGAGGGRSRQMQPPGQMQLTPQTPRMPSSAYPHGSLRLPRSLLAPWLTQELELCLNCWWRRSTSCLQTLSDSAWIEFAH